MDLARRHGTTPHLSKPGRVYLLLAPEVDRVKIGWAKDPRARLADLRIGSPVVLELAHTLPGTMRLERELHRRFADRRLHGEWFADGAAIVAEVRS